MVAQDIRWGDSNPEGVKGGGGVPSIASVGSQVIVVEGEFVRIPEEVEDTGTEVGGGVAVGCSLGGGSGLVKVTGDKLVRFV